MSLDENRLSMTVPVTIKHEKGAVVTPRLQQLVALFKGEACDYV